LKCPVKPDIQKSTKLKGWKGVHPGKGHFPKWFLLLFKRRILLYMWPHTI
jgi:hypothetical protein